MPQTTIVEIPPAEQARRLAEVRRARYGDWLALPLLWLGAAGRTPPELAAVVCCARSPVSRVVRAYRAGDVEWLETEGAGSPLARGGAGVRPETCGAGASQGQVP